MSSRVTKFVEPGACYKGDGFLRCALDSTYCNESLGEEFFSPARLQILGRSQAVKCDKLSDIAVGKCFANIDDSACTGHISSCILPKFISADTAKNTGCTVTKNNNKEHDLAVSVYGACVNERSQSQTCVWSQDDCPDVRNGNLFIPGSSQHVSAHYSPAKLCTCDKTLIGACLYPSGPVCAVSPKACEANGQYMTPFELAEDKTAGITCYLCGPSDRPVSVTKSGNSNGNPTALDVLAIIGLCALVLGVCIGFVCLCRSRLCRRRHADTATSPEGKNSPMETTMETEEGEGADALEDDFVAEVPKIYPIV